MILRLQKGRDRTHPLPRDLVKKFQLFRFQEMTSPQPKTSSYPLSLSIAIGPHGQGRGSILRVSDAERVRSLDKSIDRPTGQDFDYFGVRFPKFLTNAISSRIPWIFSVGRDLAYVLGRDSNRKSHANGFAENCVALVDASP